MSEKKKKEIAEMTETAKLLAKHDPQGLMIAKSNLDILKNRCEIEKAMKPTLNDMRKEHGLEPLEDGDVVLNKA